MAPRGKTDTPEFEAAREALITHFADVDQYEVDWDLYGYGKHLEDSRMIPALENMLNASGQRAVQPHMIVVVPLE